MLSKGSNTTSRAIAATQWRVLARDGRLRALVLATLLLAGAGLAGGVARDARLAEERNALNAEDAELWEGQGSVNPHSAAHFGRYISKPISPLTFFDPGVTEQLGTVARLEAHVQQPPRHRPAEGGAALSRFGGFSPAQALQLLAPLLIILAGFAAFSGERSRVLLRQELASGVRRTALLSGRYKALSLAALLIGAPVLLGTVILAGSSSSSALLAALALVIGYVLYLLIWVGITLGVSASCSSARTSLVVLLSLWLASSFLVPRLAGDVAARLAPTPTAAAFKANVRAVLEKGPSGHNSKDERLETFKQETLQRYGVDRVEDLPVSWDGLTLQEGERMAAQAGNAEYERLWHSYETQDTIRRFFSVVSPLLALKSFSAGLAGSDAAAHVDFVRAIESYRFAFVKLLNDDIATNAVGQDAFAYMASPKLLQAVPPFHYEPPTVAKRLGWVWPDIVVLVLWLVLTLAFAVAAARRVKPL